MLLSLLSVAFAADIVPGSHVLVKQGAAVSRPGGGWSGVPTVSDVAWPAEVLADDGDTLRVRLTSNGCVDGLQAARFLDVALTVREEDLAPLVAESARGVEPTGEAWYVGAGAPVVGRSAGVQVGAGDGLVITLPDTVAVGVSTPLPSARPPADGEGGTTYRADRGFGTFRGGAVDGPGDKLRVRRVDGRVGYAGRCVSFTFDGEGPVFKADLASTNGLAGFTSRGELRRGTALSWPDGAPAGRLREPYTPNAVEARGELTCFWVPLTSVDDDGAPGLPLCVQASTLPTKVPDATAGTRDGGAVSLSGDPIILGALDKSLIDAVIKRNLSQIRYCYQRELTNNPTLGGKLVIKFVIAKDGSVSSSVTKSSTLTNHAVEDCINGRFMRFQFPEPTGGGIVIVSYPFVFVPGQ